MQENTFHEDPKFGDKLLRKGFFTLFLFSDAGIPRFPQTPGPRVFHTPEPRVFH